MSTDELAEYIIHRVEELERQGKSLEEIKRILFEEQREHNRRRREENE